MKPAPSSRADSPDGNSIAKTNSALSPLPIFSSGINKIIARNREEGRKLSGGEELEGAAVIKVNSIQSKRAERKKRSSGECERKASGRRSNGEAGTGRRVDAIPQMPWLRSGL